MDLVSCISNLQQSRIIGEAQMLAARKIMDSQRQSGSAAVELIDAAEKGMSQAANQVSAATTGLGQALDVMA